MAVTADSFTTFGELLRYLRKRAQLSRAELARAAGYSESMIARLELNQRRPDPITIQARFVPALELETETAWVERLLALAQNQGPGARPSAGADDDGGPQAVALNSAGLLATKLFLPRPRRAAVARPRLLHRLNAALDVPLTVVSAPADWGKTSLLAAWLHRIEQAEWGGEQIGGRQANPRSSTLNPRCKAVWLALDEGDNDNSTFLRYLVAACQTIAPAIGGAALAMLQLTQSPGRKAVLRALLNDLAALQQTSVLVLDDYHLITAPAIHTAMGWMLEHLPTALHLVLATRADPPLPLHRLRARAAARATHRPTALHR